MVEDLRHLLICFRLFFELLFYGSERHENKAEILQPPKSLKYKLFSVWKIHIFLKREVLFLDYFLNTDN